MRPPFYVRQLRRDLDEWIKRGLVPESSRAAILESAGAGQGMSFASILGILGAILIGAAAMSFVRLRAIRPGSSTGLPSLRRAWS